MTDRDFFPDEDIQVSRSFRWTDELGFRDAERLV